jgi:hypothetical protein
LKTRRRRNGSFFFGKFADGGHCEQETETGMKANAVFIHQQYPRAALQVGDDEFFAVQTKRRKDIALEDDISGDLAMSEGKRLFNLSRGTLIHVKILGRFPTLAAAIEAMSEKADTELRATAD